MKKIIKNLAEKMGDVEIIELKKELNILINDIYLNSNYEEIEGDINEDACEDFFNFLNANANNIEIHKYGSNKYYFNDFIVVVAYSSTDI